MVKKWEFMKYWWNESLKMDMWQDLTGNNIQSYDDPDEAGLDGWELVQVVEQTNGITLYYFKRPVEE